MSLWLTVPLVWLLAAVLLAWLHHIIRRGSR